MTQNIWLEARIKFGHTDVNRIFSIICGPLEAPWICTVWGCDLLLGGWLLTGGSLGRLAACLGIKAVWKPCAYCSKQQQGLMTWLLSCTVWTSLGQCMWNTFIEAAFTYRQEIVAPITPANNTNPIRIFLVPFIHTVIHFIVQHRNVTPLRTHKGFFRNLNCPSSSGHSKKCTTALSCFVCS